MNRPGFLALTVLLLVATPAIAQTGQDGMEHFSDTNRTGMEGMDHNETSPSADPYADAEAKMYEAVSAASGRDAAEAWARKMIELHRGALALNMVARTQVHDPAVEKIAAAESETEQKEIRDLQSWLQTRGLESQ